MYDDIISSVPNIITRIDSSSTVGAIDLLNTDGEYDWLLNDVTVVGHTVRLYIGDIDWARDDFVIILDGIVESVSSTSPENIQLALRDRKEILNVVLQPDIIDQEYWESKMTEIDTYNSFTGNILGGNGTTTPYAYSYAKAVLPEATEDTHIPICLGKCFNIEPVLIDSWNHIYLIHESLEGITEITEVRSNGIVLDTDQFEYDLSMGILRLLDHNGGTQITCDVIGQNGESIKRLDTAPSLIQYSAADIIEWLLLEKADISNLNICYDTFGVADAYIEDASTSQWAHIRTTNLINTFDVTATYTASIEIAKDNITSRFPALRLSFSGDTLETNDISLDTVTGDISPVASHTSVEDLGSYWKITIEAASVNQLNDFAEVKCYPAIGSNFPSYTSLAVGSITIRNPSLYSSVQSGNQLTYYDDFSSWILSNGTLDIPLKPFPNTDYLGFYSKTEDTVLNATTKLINSVGGFMRFKHEGCKLQLVLLSDPGLADSINLYLLPDDIIERGLKVAAIEEPKKSITLGYKKNWKIQDEGSLAGALTDTTSDYYNLDTLNEFKNEYSTILAKPSPELDILEYPLGEDMDIVETTIWDATRAQIELDRRINLRGERRRILRINSIATSFTYDIGDIVHITHDRFGLEQGVNAIIIGIEESPTSKRVTLDVWL